MSDKAAVELSMMIDVDDLVIAWVGSRPDAASAWPVADLTLRALADVVHSVDLPALVHALHTASRGGVTPTLPSFRLAGHEGTWCSYSVDTVRTVRRNSRNWLFVQCSAIATAASPPAPPIDSHSIDSRDGQRDYMALVEVSMDGVVVHDGTVVMFANAAAAALVGAASTTDLVGANIAALVHGDDLAVLDRVRWQLASDPTTGHHASLTLLSAGQVEVPVHATFASVLWSGRPAVQVVFRGARTGAPSTGGPIARPDVIEAVITTDASFRIDSWDAGAERLYGWSEDEVLGRRIGDVIGIEDRDLHKHDMFDELFRAGQWHGALAQRHRDGRSIDVVGHTTMFRDRHGDVAGVISVNRLATTSAGAGLDRLTGMIDRSTFLGTLGRASVSQPSFVVLLDIDNFSDLNAKLGSAAGDAVLMELSNRLRGVIRTGDVIARVAGDRFAVHGTVLGNVDAKALAARLHAVVSEPVDVHDTLIGLSTSAGAAWDGEGAVPTRLFEQSERALREAKSRGGRRLCFYGPNTEAGGWDDDATFANDVRSAIRSGDMYLAYQPIVEIGTGQVRKIEALARWKHPQRGVIPPSHFIPLAERSGMIIELGYWVLERACRDAVAMSVERDDIDICVNLSAAQLRDPTLPDRVAAVLADTGLQPARLWLEVTESVLVDDQTIAPLRRLHALGLRLVIDDFGTGYATLQLLTRLPVDALKIDRSFVSGLGVDTGDTAIVRSVINLGRELGLHVVAEGVETESQRAQLSSLNCRLAQGWLFGFPLPFAETMQAIRPRPIDAEARSEQYAATERMRLDALEACRVLDTSAEASFDALVRLSAQMFDMPIALISLVHQDREWFKARIGVELTEVSRDISFCTHAIQDPHNTFVVNDARLDERFADNPFVTGDMNLRFYAGAPIRSREGLALGTICVLDRRPRQLTEQQLSALTYLAEQAGALLDLRRRAAELNDIIRANAAKDDAPGDGRLGTALVEWTTDLVMVMDAEANIRLVNSAVRPMLGYDPAEWTGRCGLDLIHPDDVPRALQALHDTAAVGGPHLPLELRVAHADGTWRRIELTANTLLGVPGVDGIILSGRDVTDRGATQRRIDQQRELIDATLDNVSDGIVACDEHGVLTVFNLAARRLHDLAGGPDPSGEWATTYGLFSADGSTRLDIEDVPLFRALKGHRVVNEEMQIVPTGRTPRLVRCNGQQLRHPSGQVIGALVVMQDISDRLEAESQTRRQMMRDQLTGVASRQQLMPHLDALLSVDPETVIVTMIDLDDLRRANDQHGHRCGDQMLAALADRLRSVCRPDDMIGRVGGDEFVVVQRGPRAANDELWRRRLQAATAFDMPFDGIIVHVTATSGSTRGRPGDVASTVLDRADEAVHAARRLHTRR